MFRPEIKFILDSINASTKYIEAECMLAGNPYIRWRVIHHSFDNEKGLVYDMTAYHMYTHTTEEYYRRDDKESQELIRRISKSDVTRLLPFIIHNPCMREARNAMMSIFINLFYPDFYEDNMGPVDDKHNAWIRDHVPEFHNSITKRIFDRRLASIKQVLDV